MHETIDWAHLPRVLSTRQLARVMGVRYDHARLLVLAGLVPAYFMGYQWVIFRDEVRARLEHDDSVSSFGLIADPDMLAGYPSVLSRREVADFFGISLNTATHWMQSGIVTARRLHSEWQIDADDLEDDLRRASNRELRPLVNATIGRPSSVF